MSNSDVVLTASEMNGLEMQIPSSMNQFSQKQKVLDVHTHMFNARYLPLRGIFKSKKILDRYNKSLASICWYLTDYSDFHRLERVEPTHLDDRHNWKLENEELRESMFVESFIQSLATDCETLVAASIAGKTSKSHKQVTKNILRQILDVMDNDDESLKGDFDFENMTDSKILGFPFADMFINYFRSVFSTLEHALDFVDFFWNLTQSESRIYIRIREYYKAQDVDFHLVHHMMDMSYPYVKAMGHNKYGEVKIPYYSQKRGISQLSQMRNLSRLANGRLTGFSAFDPFRFANGNYDEAQIEEILEQSLEKYKVIGFKFYPPMGYRPDKNEDHRLDLVIKIFLKFCSKKQIPIFTHCTPSGFEVTENSGRLSHPLFWRNVIENNDWGPQIRLCFGHAGGGFYEDKNDSTFKSSGWTGDSANWVNGDNYAYEVVRLCCKYPNIFCELSNFGSILYDPVQADFLKANLERELNAKPSGKYPFYDKVMYGTDWHMTGMVNDVVEYYLKLAEMFDQNTFKDHKDKFFYQNALSYLKLDQFPTYTL